MVLLGQIMGWVAAALTLYSYQCKEQKKLILVQTMMTISICISYLILNALSGILLNVVCIIRNLIIYRKDLKIFSYWWWPYLLAVIMGIMGIISWQGPISLLVIVALMFNTVFLYLPNVQNLRKSVIFTSGMIAIYDIYFSAWGGMMNELIAITSSIIGICRYRNVKKSIGE